MADPKGVCVKVNELRPRGYNNLKEWCVHPENILVTRHGRVFITDNGQKTIFTYKGSEWANPFKVGGCSKYSLDESLRLFEIHLDRLLEDDQCLQRFLLLRHAHELGCFCKSGDKCHRDIILKKLKSAV